MSKKRRSAYSTLRLIVVLVVIAFIVSAIWNSARQLVREHTVREQQIATLTRQIARPRPIDQSSRGEPESNAAETVALEELRDLEKARLIPRNFWWPGILFGFLAYSIALILSAKYWHACLGALGHRVPLRIAIAAHVLGQLGKYVPGKAMVVVMRTTALKRYADVPLLPSTIAVFIETLTMMACGAAIAGVVVALIPAPAWIRWLSAALTLTAFLPTLPRFFRIILRRLEATRFGKNVSLENQRYDLRLMLAGWGWMGSVWFLIGTSFWLIVLATPGNPLQFSGWQAWGLCLATISLGVVAGFVSLIPGGAGIRESVIAVVLAPATGMGIALVAAIMARLIFLIAELLGAAVARWYLHRWSDQNTLDSSP